MIRAGLIGGATLALASLGGWSPAAAQPTHHHGAPATADPHAGHMTPAEPADPHAGHMTSMEPDPHAGHVMPSETPAAEPMADEPAIPDTPPLPTPTDHAADRDFDPAAMARARAVLRGEHGAVVYGKAMTKLAEYQVRDGRDGYRWDVQASYGGDINRFVLKSEGEATHGEGVDAAEVQALYSRAVTPFFDLHLGVRQDFQPRDRTYLTVGTEGLLPYWFDVEAAIFLSDRGEALARAEGTYDLRLTQRLILQPRVELNFAGQNTPSTRTGSGLSNAELGLRLRYEIHRAFAPYIGVSYDRRFGKTADYARAAGEDPEATSFVVGLRAWF